MPATYISRVAVRRTLPLEVFGTAPGGTSATTSGGIPTASTTFSLTAASSRSRSPGSVARVSATMTRLSVPCSAWATPKAATHPRRIPGTDAANSSSSCGTRLRPALMMRSLWRPAMKTSPSAR